jgi:uncharacterized protein (DUF433 family)
MEPSPRRVIGYAEEHKFWEAWGLGMAVAHEVSIEPGRGPAGFYAPAEACRLTRVPPSTLQYWVRVGIVSPSRRVMDPHGQMVRDGYSLADLGYIRLLHQLRSRGVPTENAVRFLTAMLDKIGPPGPTWGQVRVWVDGKRVYLAEPSAWGTMEAQRPAGHNAALQRVADTFFGGAFIGLKQSADSILVPAELLEHVEINAEVVDGEPVIRGTRIPTRTIQALASTRSTAEILEMYPFLTCDQVKSALEYEQYLDRAA